MRVVACYSDVFFRTEIFLKVYNSVLGILHGFLNIFYPPPLVLIGIFYFLHDSHLFFSPQYLGDRCHMKSRRMYTLLMSPSGSLRMSVTHTPGSETLESERVCLFAALNYSRNLPMTGCAVQIPTSSLR